MAAESVLLPAVDDGGRSSASSSAPAAEQWSPQKAKKMANGGWLAPASRLSSIASLPDIAAVDAETLMCRWLAQLLDSTRFAGVQEKRRRLAGKQPEDTRTILERIAGAPSEPARQIGSSWKQRRDAFFYFSQVAANMYQMSVRPARDSLVQTWKRTPLAIKNNMVFVMELVEAPAHEASAPVPRQPDAVVECFGVLLTWHTRWGRSADFVNKVFQNCDALDEQCELLRSHPPLEEAFHSFDTWVAAIVKDIGFTYYACAMELCQSTAPTGKVHLHAYLACNWSLWRGGSWAPVKVDTRTLSWGSFTPHVQMAQAKGRGNPRRMLQEGLYYCVAPKIGSVFRSANFAVWKVCVVFERVWRPPRHGQAGEGPLVERVCGTTQVLTENGSLWHQCESGGEWIRLAPQLCVTRHRGRRGGWAGRAAGG